MDKDRIKGKAEDIAGRVKRQTGEWTGNENAQAEGATQQLKGKARNAMGKAKDAVRDAADDVNRADRRDEDLDRDKNAA